MEKGKAKKKVNTKDAKNESLANELRELIPQLDCDGLEFLIEQAKVHLYNMQVDEHNRAVIAAASEEQVPTETLKSRDTGFTIHGTESGYSYYLHYQNDDVMFSRNEMAHLAKIVNSPGTDLEIRERLYNWFDRERKDVFSVTNIRNKFDDRLKALVKVIKKSVKV